MQINLSNTNQQLEILTGIAGSIHYHCGYADIPTAIAGGTASVDVEGNITTAASTAIVVAPAASTTRRIQHLTIYNNGVSNNITLRKDIAGTKYIYLLVSLANGESLRIVNDVVGVYDSGGRLKTQNQGDSELIGGSRSIYKIGTAPEAAGQFYGFWKDSGFPGAWAPGTPGLNGRNTDGTQVADTGSLNTGNPASGYWYLRDMNIAATVAGQIILTDILWVNSGLVVTTITAQAITQPTLPARDNNGATLGEGVQVGILVTAATTNAGAITNMTLSYTNSDGTAGRTATISSFPATAVIGTLVKFQSQAGDKGVRSIQSITLGTTLTAGSISLICFEELVSSSIILANTGSLAFPRKLDLKLYNGHCILPFIMASGTGAVTINGNIYFINK